MNMFVNWNELYFMKFSFCGYS